jgi:GTPase SAR1 family protein
MTQMEQQYQQFQERRHALLGLIQRQIKIVSALNMAGRKDVLDRLQERVEADNFKVLVLGEFKRGKSTFINAMLGEEILPAYARPCTAIINEIKWADSPVALLHYPAAADGTTPQPKSVAVKELEQYVTIRDGMPEKEAIRSIAYDKVELFWPLDLCRNGVEIIDSPGLNEHEIRQKVTMDYLSTVDAILFVLSCEVLGSQSELDVIDNTLRSMGHKDLFFICNRYNMIRPKERDDICKHALAKLAPRTERGAERVFFIDALGALDGRVAGDHAAVEQSQVPKVERELAKFLTTERGKVKILRPATELKNAIQEARRIIPERTLMLRTDVKTLEARYEEAQVPLRQLETKRSQIVMQLTNFQEDMKMLVGDRALAFYHDLSDQIGQWAQDYELQTPVKFVSMQGWKPEGLKPQIERAVQELVEHLSQRVESELANWQKAELQPLVLQRLEARRQELDAKAAEFVDQLDELRLKVAGLSVTPVSEGEIGKRKISALERILSAAGGFLIGGFGSAGIGAIYGYEEMLKSLLPQILLSVATLVLVGFNPWILFPVMAGGGVIQGLTSTNSTNKKLKEVISQKYAAEIRASAVEQANKLSLAVAQELAKIESAVDQGLSAEIQSVRDQVNSILSEKQKGQSNVDQKLLELDLIAQELNQVDGELDDLIAQIVV